MKLLAVNVPNKERYKSQQKMAMEASQAILDSCKGKLWCPMYKNWMRLCANQINAFEDNSSTNLWRRRSTHMSEKGCRFWQGVFAFLAFDESQ